MHTRVVLIIVELTVEYQHLQIESFYSGSGELFGDNFLTSYQTFLPTETSENPSNSEMQNNEENNKFNTETQFNQSPKDPLNIGSMSSQAAELTTSSTEATDDDSEREDSEGSPQSIYDDMSIADIIKGNTQLEFLN